MTVESIAGDKHVGLDSKRGEATETGQWRGAGLEVLWWDGYDHAGVLDTRQDRAKLVKVVVKYCSGE